MSATPELLRFVPTRLALTFPYISLLFIEALTGLERKIGEKLRSTTSRLATSQWQSRR